MCRIVHISDLHFGAVNPATLTPLRAAVNHIAPQVLVVSGDLTQRAKRNQFIEAAEYVRSLDCDNTVVVPGNHDIPLWNPWKRFVRPRKYFNKYIRSAFRSTYIDRDIAIAGIDTARSAAIENGRVSMPQLGRALDYFSTAPLSACRIIVAHHPFVVPESPTQSKRVGRADSALATFVDSHVDLLLTGHRHIPWVRSLGTDLLTIHAGTATSHRLRGHSNSFHEIVINGKKIVVRCYVWKPQQANFVIAKETNWTLHPYGARRVVPEPDAAR